MNLPPLNTILTFICVVEHRKFNKAAASLSLTESAVSHQIKKLEETLGVRLMERGRNGLKLTEAGERFYIKSSFAVKQLNEVVRELGQESQSNLVVTLPPSLATLWLAPELWNFYEENNQIEISILPTIRNCNLENENIDIGIRLSAAGSEWTNYNSLQLCEEFMFPVMSPEKAKELKEKKWQNFSKDNWFIQNKQHPEEWIDWCKKFNEPSLPKNRVKTLYSFEYAVNAAVSGRGIAMGRSPMVDAFIEDGRLVSPYCDEQKKLSTGNDYYAIWSKQTSKSDLTNKFLDWLVKQNTREV